MIVYLLKSAACLSLLLLFYHLVLEKEKMHKFNRFYLLGSVLFSFLAPLYVIYTEVTPIITEATNNSTEFVFISEAIPMVIIEETSLNYSLIGIAIYILISFIFLFRFGKNLFHILQKTRKNTRIKYNKAIIVLVEDKILPHTFWNYIFINKEDYETENVEKELFTHELTHVTQKHTLDVIILELLQVIFWINPLFIILKKAVQLNHEFLADETVINKHKNTSQYQHLLLNKAAWKNEYYLASNLNYSLTKKRLKMMTTQSSQSKILLKKLAVIPLLVGFLFLFAERVEAQEKNRLKQKSINQNTLEAYKEYGFRNTYFSTKDNTGNTIKVPFSILSDEKKKNIGPVEPLILNKKIVSKELLINLKKGDLDKIIFIDGEIVNKEELKKYNTSDFSYYSWKYKNHNSKINKWMKHYFLETTEYFINQNKKRKSGFLDFLKKEKKLKINEKHINQLVFDKSKNFHLENYLSLYNNYESKRNKKLHFVKRSKENKEYLISSFSYLENLYSKLSKKNKAKVKKPINPHYPYVKLSKNGKVFFKLGKELIKEKNNANETTKNQKMVNSNLADFNIHIKKDGNTFKLKCTKGCDWTDLTFNLNKDEFKTVDQFGAGNKTDYSSDFKILVKNIESKYNGYTFTVESLKGTNWLNRSKLNTKNKTEITQHLF